MVDRGEPRGQTHALVGLPLTDVVSEQTVLDDERSKAQEMLDMIGRGESWYIDPERKPLRPEKAVDITDRTGLEEGSIATLVYFETPWRSGPTVDIIVTRFRSDSSSSCDYALRGDERFKPDNPSFQLTANSLRIDPQSLYDITVDNAPRFSSDSSQ